MIDRPTEPERRGFLKKAAAALIGAATLVPPLAAGLVSLLDPLRQKTRAGGFIRVTSLRALPEDGTPRQFPVVADRQDAWNKFPNDRVGAVYLRRDGPNSVQAINVVCPHAGCFVNYAPGQSAFVCPCHDSIFALDGAIKDPASPSPRALDSLAVEIRNKTEVWVQFRNFRAGTPHKIPIA